MQVNLRLLLIGLLLASPVHLDSAEDVTDLARWMSGHFKGQTQDRELFVTRVDIPALPGTSMYLQWHAGGPDGLIDQQRIWSYEAKGDHIVMRFYTFEDKARDVLTGIRSATDAAGRDLSVLSASDFFAYPEACNIILHRKGDLIEGGIPNRECRIFNRAEAYWMVPNLQFKHSPGRIWEKSQFTFETNTGAEAAPAMELIQDYVRID